MRLAHLGARRCGDRKAYGALGKVAMKQRSQHTTAQQQMQTLTPGLNLELNTLGIATLRFTEGRRRNPLTRGILRCLEDFLCERKAAWETNSEADPIRTIVLEAEGPIFCSGHSFDDFAGASSDEIRSTLELCARVNMLLSQVPQPTVAAVAGGCLAGGAQLAASCDLLLAHRQDAWFSLPGAGGGGYCHTPSVAVCARVGAHKALELGLLGERVSADEAVAIGLANRCFEGGSFRSSVESLTQKLASHYTPNLAAGKLVLYEQARAGLDTAAKYEVATPAMVAMFETPSFKAHMQAFLERRREKTT